MSPTDSVKRECVQRAITASAILTSCQTYPYAGIWQQQQQKGLGMSALNFKML